VLAGLLSTTAIAQSPPGPPAADKPMAQPAPRAPVAQPAPAPAPLTGSVKIMTTLPADGKTVTNYYKQNVYDTADNKIGDVQDLLVDKSGKITAAMIGVGGFLGMGEKDVAVPFEALQLTQKNNKWFLVMSSTKDELKNAPGWKYDRTTTTWISDKTAASDLPRPTVADRERAPVRQ
jgi:hypothetical protein